MSFYTSLLFYRPVPPPPVTASDVARFLMSVRDLELLAGGGLLTLQVKFGSDIDVDDHPTSWEEPTATPSDFTVRDIEWDFDLSSPANLQEMIYRLVDDERRIYRRFASMGALDENVVLPISRIESPENEIDFTPDTLGLQIGPVIVGTLSSDMIAQVGWIALSISGCGYLWPWSGHEVVAALDGSSAIRRLANRCREHWPVPPAAASPDVVEQRREMGELWPYGGFDQPHDWHWGVHESG